MKISDTHYKTKTGLIKRNPKRKTGEIRVVGTIIGIRDGKRYKLYNDGYGNHFYYLDDKFKTRVWVQGYVCPHCGQYLGKGDTYDLMKAHIFSCSGKSATEYRRAIDEGN